jgi:NAD+ kinase
MLFDRALVFGDSELLEFTVLDGRRVVLTVDGRELGLLAPGDVVSCTADPRPARMLTFGRHDFHQVLKAKFGLADR